MYRRKWKGYSTKKNESQQTSKPERRRHHRQDLQEKPNTGVQLRMRTI